MSTTSEAISLMKSVGSHVERLETVVAQAGQSRDASQELIRKALGDGRGAKNVAAIGFDGAAEMNLLNLGSPSQKAVGMGNFLKHVAAANGSDVLGVDASREQVVKALDKMGSRVVSKTALAESSGFTGGYTVPVQFYGELLRLIAEEAFVRSSCMSIPMQSRSILIPALNQSGTPATGTSSFFGGIAASWQPEAATYPESEPTFRQVELVARDLVFTCVASNQLLQDNAVALDTLLTTLFKESMAWFYDWYILNGNGAAQPLGVLNAPATLSESRSSTGHVKLDDLANMVGKLLLNGWKSACWIMHPSVMQELIQLTNGATNSPFLVWVNPTPPTEDGPIAQKLPTRLFNIPVYWSEKVPVLGSAGDVTLVDLSKQVVGDRLALQIDTSKDIKFFQNQMVWRIIARWDSQPWMNSAVTMAGGGGYQMSYAVQLAA